jgi:hypothetical protein
MATEKGTNYRFPQVFAMPQIKEALDKFEVLRKEMEQEK